MKQIGLTGGIGCGKSTVAMIFKELFEIPCYDCDSRAKALMISSAEIREAIIKLFSHDAYTYDGTVWQLNRGLLSEKIFTDNSLRLKLEAIVHPAVNRDYREWAAWQKAPYVIKESAILFESRADKGLDYIIVVDAPLETRIKRVTLRDGTTPSQVRGRIKAQSPPQELIQKADYLIVNDNKKLLIPEIVALDSKFRI